MSSGAGVHRCRIALDDQQDQDLIDAIEGATGRTRNALFHTCVHIVLTSDDSPRLKASEFHEPTEPYITELAIYPSASGVIRECYRAIAAHQRQMVFRALIRKGYALLNEQGLAVHKLIDPDLSEASGRASDISLTYADRADRHGSQPERAPSVPDGESQTPGMSREQSPSPTDNDEAVDARQKGQAYRTEAGGDSAGITREPYSDEDNLDTEESDGPREAFDIDKLLGSIGS